MAHALLRAASTLVSMPGFVGLLLGVAPALRPESQVTMTLFLDRTTRVEFVVADQNIYYAGNALRTATGESRAEILAKQVVVQRYALNVPASRLLDWQQGLFDSIGSFLVPLQRELNDKYQHRPGLLRLDGDTYDVRYTQFSTGIHLTVPESPIRTALEKWAEAVHSEVVSLARQSAQEILYE